MALVSACLRRAPGRQRRTVQRAQWLGRARGAVPIGAVILRKPVEERRIADQPPELVHDPRSASSLSPARDCGGAGHRVPSGIGQSSHGSPEGRVAIGVAAPELGEVFGESVGEHPRRRIARCHGVPEPLPCGRARHCRLVQRVLAIARLIVEDHRRARRHARQHAFPGAAATRQRRHQVGTGGDCHRRERHRGIEPVVPGGVPVGERVDLLERARCRDALSFGGLDVERERRLARRPPGHGQPEAGRITRAGRGQRAIPVLVGSDPNSPTRITVVADPRAQRVTRRLLMRNHHLPTLPRVHRAGEPGVRLAVHQHPDHPHRRVELQLDRIHGAEPPRGLHLEQDVGAGVAGDQGDVVLQWRVCRRRIHLREEPAGPAPENQCAEGRGAGEAHFPSRAWRNSRMRVHARCTWGPSEPCRPGLRNPWPVPG